MTEEGDNPTVSGGVQSTSMEPLNDELTPKTEKPRQEVKSENNIQHEISGFQKFLATSAQVIRLHWIPILISSIICFVLNSDIAEIYLARNLFALSFNAFVILLMFKLIKGEDKGNSETEVSLDAGTDYEVKSNEEEIDNIEIDSTEKIADMENGNKLKTEEIESLQNPDATIHAKFPGISKLKDYKSVFSQPTEIGGITWKINMFKDCSVLNFSMIAVKKNAVNWYCPVITEFRLISQKSNGIVHRKEKKVLCDANGSSSFIEAISYKDLFDEKKGYVTDDSITVAVAFRTFPRSIDEAKKITLRHQFSEISKLTRDNVYSQPTENDGITWKMSVDKGSNQIAFCLHAEKDNAVEWWFPVFVDLHLVSQKKSGEIVRIDSKKVVCDEKKSAHYIGLISSKDLFDEKNGYVKDDSIIVVMAITVIPIN